MSVITRTKSFLTSLKPNVKYRFGGMSSSGLPAVADWGVPDYIRSASDIGWFYRGLAVIAYAVSKQQWHLYKCHYKDGQKQRDEIPQHIILDLLSSVNPYMTFIDYITLQTMYLVAVGSCYTVLDFNTLRRPECMWPVRPDRITPLRENPMDYISAYEYRVGNDRIRLEVAEVLAVRHPNLANPLLGSGAGEALKQQLATERYSNALREKLFHNDATPGLMFLFEESPGPDAEKDIVERWKEQHQGWQNIRKPGFLFGKVNVKEMTMAFKDLDLTNQDKARGRQILQVMGVPPIIAGDTEDLNKSTSDAALYVFTSFTVDPILTLFRESWNEQLVPLYPQAGNAWLELGYDSPVPKDRAAMQASADSTLKNCGCTLNEYRQMLDMPMVDEGDVYLVPSNITVVPADQLAEYIPPAPSPGPFGLSYLGLPEHAKNVGCLAKTRQTTRDAGEATPAQDSTLNIVMDDATKTAYWYAWVDKANKHEVALVKDLQALFKSQRGPTLASFRAGSKRPYNTRAARKELLEVFKKHLPDTLQVAYEDATLMIPPKHPKAMAPPKPKRAPTLPPPPGPDMDALKWLKTRMNWAADTVGEDIADAINGALRAGFEAGEGADLIGARIESVFEGCEKYRALRIARTEVMTASNQGAIQGYKDMGIEKTEWLAERDERCCDDCYGMNGDVSKIGSGYEPPLHVNCRCTVVPVE